MSLDNSLMMEIYPFGGLWGYLKFHFIDGITKQSVMLLDKTRVDYDADKKKEKKATLKVTKKSDKELNNMLKGFGLGKKQTNEERANEILKNLEE